MDWIFLLIAFAAEVIGTVVGFGSSTIALPLSLFWLDFPTALALVAFLHIFGNMGRIGFFRHGLDKNLLLKFGLPSVLFTAAGAMLVKNIPFGALKMVLGFFLLIYAVWSWSGRWSIRPSGTSAVLGGSISGFFAGLIGTGGALRGVFLNVFDLPKEKYIATAAAIALAVDLTRIPLYLREGFLNPRFYIMIPAVAAVAFLGSLVGKRIVTKIPQDIFRKIVLAAIFIIGLKFIYDWLI